MLERQFAGAVGYDWHVLIGVSWLLCTCRLPTPIQQEAVPLVLTGGDVLAVCLYGVSLACVAS